jgi:hypothetical protein
MAIGCQDVSARMMDLLYGELSGDDRAAVEAHLAGCDSCRAELAAFHGTRAAARRALDADTPPPRVHDAILRAAAAAAAAKQAQPIAPRPVLGRPSFWERLRGRWTLPTFATIGAVAVVVLASKVFLEPEKTVELGRQTVASPAGEATPSPVPANGSAEPGPVNGQPPSAGDEAKKAAEPKVDRERNAKQEVSSRAAASHHSAGKAASSAAGARSEGPFGTLQGSGKSGGGLGGLRKESRDDSLDGLREDRASRNKSFPAAPASRPAKPAFAPPPPPRVQPAPPPTARGSEPSAAKADEDSGQMSPRRRTGGADLPGGAGSPPPAAHASPKMKKAAPSKDELEGAAAESERAPAASAPQAEEKRRAAPKDNKPAVESPVLRADRLFAEGRWAEAARAYRELLQRDPHNGNAAHWKQRLAAAEEQVAREAPAAATSPAP